MLDRPCAPDLQAGRLYARSSRNAGPPGGHSRPDPRRVYESNRVPVDRRQNPLSRRDARMLCISSSTPARWNFFETEIAVLPIADATAAQPLIQPVEGCLHRRKRLFVAWPAGAFGILAIEVEVRGRRERCLSFGFHGWPQ